MTTTMRESQAVGAGPEGGPPWWARTGTALLPLRAFLGGTFVYAGLVKLADPSYLDPSAPQSVQAQMHQLAPTSPIGPLVSLAAAHASTAGLLIAFGELAVGLGTLLGLWTRVAAAGGLLLSLSFWLTVSWHTTPYFYGSDVVFAVAWLTLLITGDGGVLSLAAVVARSVPGPAHTGGQGRVDRRVLLRTGGVAAAVGVAALALGGLVARLGRSAESGTEGTGRAPEAPGGGATPSPTGSSGTGRPATRAPGVAVAKAADVPVGRAVRAQDPHTGRAVWVVHTRRGFRAFSAVCTHAGCTVGFVRSAGQFACPCHGATYDAGTGRVLSGPAPAPLPPKKVAVVDGEIRLV